MSKKKIILFASALIIIIILTAFAIVKIKNKQFLNQSTEIIPDTTAPTIVLGDSPKRSSWGKLLPTPANRLTGYTSTASRAKKALPPTPWVSSGWNVLFPVHWNFHTSTIKKKLTSSTKVTHRSSSPCATNRTT